MMGPPPPFLMEAFSATGTAHIIAISGFNMSIIAGVFSGLSIRLFGKRRAMPVALAGIILYTILVGASAAVVRAAIMGCLYVIATHYGRQTEALNGQIAAAMLMTLLNPQTLWDLGFQYGTQINTEKHRFLFYFFICANLCASVSYFLGPDPLYPCCAKPG